MSQTLIILMFLINPIQIGLNNIEETVATGGDMMECSKDADCPQIECYRTFCVEQKCYMSPSCA